MIADPNYAALVARICEKNKWGFEQAEQGLLLEVKIGPQLTKRVAIQFVEEQGTGELWARYVADAGPSEILDPTFCLRLNGEDRFVTGCVGLRGERLVFLDSQLVSEADSVEVTTSIRNVARGATALGRLIDDAKQGKGTGRYVRNPVLDSTERKAFRPPEEDAGPAAG